MKNNELTDVQIWLLLVTVFIAITVGGYISFQKLSVSDMAAWIQAIFSVVAIAAAIWISQRERRHDRRERSEMERKSVVGILVLIERGRALVEAMGGIELGDPSEAMMHSVGVIAGKLESLDQILSPSPILLRCSLFAANYLRVSSERARSRRYGDLWRLVQSLQKCHDQISKFYGITDEDYPEKPDW